MANADYVKGQLARLGAITEANPHYTLQLRDFEGRHTNWMNCDAAQLDGIGRVLSGVKVRGTPGAQWRAAGEPDPHDAHYNCERAELAMGDLTDDELANGAFMYYDQPLNIAGIVAGTHSSPIAWMTAVKDRIRWLSRKLTDAQALLAEKDARIAELERQATMDGGLARLALNAAKDQLASAEAALDKAQAMLAEKDARIAQLAAHARGKNKALANALKEIERLKRTIETGLDNELALVGERTELRAQLDQLKAAPAERGDQLPMYTCTGKGGEYVKLGYAKPAGAIKTIQGDSGLIVYRDTATGQLYFRDPADFNQRMSQLADLVPCSLGGDMIVDRTCAGGFTRLNPATADSDVREVK